MYRDVKEINSAWYKKNRVYFQRIYVLFISFLLESLSESTTRMGNFVRGILRYYESRQLIRHVSHESPEIDRSPFLEYKCVCLVIGMNSLLDIPRASLHNRCKYCRALRLLRTFRRRMHRS